MRGLPAPLFAASLVIGGWESRAAADEPHAVMVLGEGGDADDLAARIEARLTAPYVARDPAPLRRSLTSGHAPTLAAAARQTAKDAKLVGHVGPGLRAAHAQTAVLLHAHASKRAVSVHVWLIEAGAREAVVDREITLPPRTSAVDEADAVWNVLAPGFTLRDAPAPEAAAPPATVAPDPPKIAAMAAPGPAPPDAAAPAPVVAEPPIAEMETVPETPPASRQNALFAGHVALGAGTRHFTYVDRLTPSLRDYDLTAAPLVAVDAEVHPFARSHLPILRDLGLTGDYRRAFALSSADSGGASVGTSWSGFDVGARERIHLTRAFVLGVHGGYGQNDYTFAASPAGDARLADVRYRFAEGGLDADLTVRRFSFAVSGSYLGVLSSGLVGTYFPRASVGGIDVKMGVAHPIVGGLELSLQVAYTRFFWSMNPEPGDSNVAGGALDQMGSCLIGIGYVL